LSPFFPDERTLIAAIAASAWGQKAVNSAKRRELNQVEPVCASAPQPHANVCHSSLLHRPLGRCSFANTLPVFGKSCYGGSIRWLTNCCRISPSVFASPLGGQRGDDVVNRLRIRDNTRSQFQIQMRTVDGTITCVVTVAPEKDKLLAERREVALQLAKRLAQQLDTEIRSARRAA
jgi:hypothetical protein